MYHYGLIGNCQSSALISNTGSIDWLCLPRPDSPPVFGRLLDPNGGHFSVESPEAKSGIQEYIPNTNVLVTTVQDSNGSSYRITDFFPRFQQYGRTYRPTTLFRIVEPVSGTPIIRAVCKPVNGWEKSEPQPIRGNSHLRYEIRNEALKLLTNMPLTYLSEGTLFPLTDPIYFALSWGAGVEDDLIQVSLDFLKKTIDYWRTWVKHCSIPSQYQKETIRSALTLKLHCYEDTGAILAALTTSLPEEPGKNRNWDYRFCWLRDAYFILSAFNNLGHFEEMEGFLKFLLDIAEGHEQSKNRLSPVYRLDRTLPIPEIEHTAWLGHQGSAPVRSGNQAAEHTQNDVYGEMVLSLAPIFLDERFHHLRTERYATLINNLAKFCAMNVSRADAGLWELRNGWQEHTFSNLMCWAGLERMSRIAGPGFPVAPALELESELKKAQQAVERAIVNGSIRNSPTDPTLDAALLQLPLLRFPNAEANRFTILTIAENLRFNNHDAFLYRYLRNDDFGTPQSAFVICSFWMVQALNRIGEYERAKTLLDHAMQARNPLGLFSEHFDPVSGRQFGNFPQAYSHVGQINAAFAVSPPWNEVL